MGATGVRFQGLRSGRHAGTSVLPVSLQGQIQRRDGANGDRKPIATGESK